MKYILIFWLSITAFDAYGQEKEPVKKSDWWNRNPSYVVPIDEVFVSARRPMKEIGIQQTKLDSTVLKENIALSMADVLTFNSSIFVNNTVARRSRRWHSAVRRPHTRR